MHLWESVLWCKLCTTKGTNPSSNHTAALCCIIAAAVSVSLIFTRPHISLLKLKVTTVSRLFFLIFKSTSVWYLRCWPLTLSSFFFFVVETACPCCTSSWNMHRVHPTGRNVWIMHCIVNTDGAFPASNFQFSVRGGEIKNLNVSPCLLAEKSFEEWEISKRMASGYWRHSCWCNVRSQLCLELMHPQLINNPYERVGGSWGHYKDDKGCQFM